MLSSAATTDPNLHSMWVETATGSRYLHTSPELAMKRLLAAGSGDIYQICRVFRAGESGDLHNPEFTMLEYYRIGMDHPALMRDLADLIDEACAGAIELAAPEYLSYAEAFGRHGGFDPFTDGENTIVAALGSRGVDVPVALQGDRQALLDLAMGMVVAPALGQGRLSFIYDFPVEQAALARIRPGSPPLAERFEAFLSGVELANGFHELTDAGEQASRFRCDLERRRRQGLADVPVDAKFLAALAAGIPDCAGVAVGLDRLIMLIAGARRIDDVLAFGWERV